MGSIVMNEQQAKMKQFLEEYLKTFEAILKDEQEKLRNFVSFDLEKINASISKQQANEMRISNIEKKRIDVQRQLGYANMTFKQIIDTYEEKSEMNDLYDKINHVVNEVRFYNQKAMDIAKGQLNLYEIVKDEAGTYTKDNKKVGSSESMMSTKF